MLQHVWWLSLSSADGRGTTAAEKQQSLQSLICKYANEGVIKIGRLSVALWLLMNSNLQERGRGWWAKNEKKEQAGIVLFLLKHKGKSEWESPWNVKGLFQQKETTWFFSAFKLVSDINKATSGTHPKHTYRKFALHFASVWKIVFQDQQKLLHKKEENVSMCFCQDNYPCTPSLSI